MGGKVGAIPSAVGGGMVTLSHVGKVFRISEDSLLRWRGWTRHTVKDQVGVWMLTCFVGMALPCMLSLEFIRNASVAGDRVAAMTADGIAGRYPDHETASLVFDPSYQLPDPGARCDLPKRWGCAAVDRHPLVCEQRAAETERPPGQVCLLRYPARVVDVGPLCALASRPPYRCNPGFGIRQSHSGGLRSFDALRESKVSAPGSTAELVSTARSDLLRPHLYRTQPVRAQVLLRCHLGAACLARVM